MTTYPELYILAIKFGTESGLTLPFVCESHYLYNLAHDVYTTLAFDRPNITMTGVVDKEVSVLCIDVGPKIVEGDKAFTSKEIIEGLRKSVGTPLEDITTRDAIIANYSDPKFTGRPHHSISYWFCNSICEYCCMNYSELVVDTPLMTWEEFNNLPSKLPEEGGRFKVWVKHANAVSPGITPGPDEDLVNSIENLGIIDEEDDDIRSNWSNSSGSTIRRAITPPNHDD